MNVDAVQDYTIQECSRYILSSECKSLIVIYRKRNSRALSNRMSKIQRTKKETQKEGWNSKNASGKTSERDEGDKAHGGIHQCNWQTRIIKQCKKNGYKNGLSR